MVYKKETWEGRSIKSLKENLKDYSKLNFLLENKIIGFNHKEHMEIKNKIQKGEDLVKEVLKDKEEAIISLELFKKGKSIIIKIKKVGEDSGNCREYYQDVEEKRFYAKVTHPNTKEMAKDAVFAKEVKHPGSRPNPFIRNTLQNKLPLIIMEEMYLV